MKTPKILLIDDEEELVTTLVERLEIRGMEAEAVTNGHEGLERMHHGEFDVVVADLKMPGLSGLETIDILREKYPQVKIILITGHGRGSDEELDQKLEGVDNILMKPFDINTLVEKIREVLKNEE
ncbi:response regulator [bacterium]|nr:response regulator [bacterium]